jgi:dTDP-4-dehydrorhamnose reductase
MSIYKSIVITGGGGMLAHALADALKLRGHQPIVLTRAECDVAKETDIRKIFEYQPTLLLNCAAHTKVDLCEQEPALADAINGYSVGKMAALCRATNTFLVHLSTDFVFPGDGTRPYRVDDAVGPLSAYGRSKHLGETEIQKNAPSDWLIVRTAWVYGRHGANFPRTMVTLARAGKPLTVVSDQIGAPTYTVDLADGILQLIDHGGRGIFHFTNSGQTNWFEFAKAALKTFNVDHPVFPITSADWEHQRPTAAPRPSYSVLDLDPFAKLTGKTPRPWQTALTAFHDEVEKSGGY